jgi:hypothetical protein
LKSATLRAQMLAGLCPGPCPGGRSLEGFVDLKKLTRGEQVVGIAGVVLLIFSFVDWFGFSLKGAGRLFSGVGGGGNAWDFTLCWLAVIIGIVMVAQIVLDKFANVKMPELGSVTWGQVHLVLGVVAFLFVLIKLIVGPSLPSGADAVIDVSRKLGIFVGLIASAGLAVGGYLIAKERGELPAQLGGSKPTA